MLFVIFAIIVEPQRGQLFDDAGELVLDRVFLEQEVWQGLRKSFSTAECSQVKLLDSLIVRKLQIDEIKLSQVSDNDFCAFSKRDLHH